MPVEPPVVSPRDLAAAYAALTPDPSDPTGGVIRPIAGGTDLMVALTGELGEPPVRMVDLWGIDALRGIALDGDGVVAGGADHLHGDPPVAVVPRASPRAGRGGRDDRRGPDPEPRDARREHRERVAGGRHAARPARDGRGRSCSVGPRRARRCPPREFWPAYRRTALAPRRAHPAHPHPVRAGPRGPVPQGRDAARPVDQQGRHGPRLARRGADRDLVRCPSGARVRGGHADPCDRAPRPSSRVASRRPRPRTSPPRRSPASCSPSTTSAPPPSTGASCRRGSSTGSSARPAAGDAIRSSRDSSPRLFEGAPALPGGSPPPALPRTTPTGSSRPPARSPTRCPKPSSSSWSTRIRASARRPRACRRCRSRSRATTAAPVDRTSRRRARAAQPRVRGAVRLPLLRLRGRPVARGAPARVRAALARATARPSSRRAIDAVIDIAADRHARLTAHAKERPR